MPYLQLSIKWMLQPRNVLVVVCRQSVKTLLQCFDTVRSVTGMTSGPQNIVPLFHKGSFLEQIGGRKQMGTGLANHLVNSRKRRSRGGRLVLMMFSVFSQPTILFLTRFRSGQVSRRKPSGYQIILEFECMLSY